MALRIGINGIGRIGKLILRTFYQRKVKGLEIAQINDLIPPEHIVDHLKFDSVHGRWDADLSIEGSHVIIDGHKIPISSSKDPRQIPWRSNRVDIVLECTGFFVDRQGAAGHLEAGAKKVLISAPAKDPDGTFVMGINHGLYDSSKHHIISNASCTTNCLAPVAKVLNDHFKIIRGFMNTIHSYTNDQVILDRFHKDPRRARAGAVNQIPTTTGAAKAIGLVIPELKGKLDGIAVRVPTPNVSLVDLVCQVEKSTSKEEVNEALKKAAAGPLKGILDVTSDPVVSGDFNGCTLSSTVDMSMTGVIGGSLVKILSWYDNETGFSHRMIDLTELVAKAL